MRVFCDTTILIASVLESHADHDRAFSVMERVRSGKDEGVIAAHSLAEVYSSLTRMPVPFRHSPELALLSIEENILKHFKISALSGDEYAALVREAALARVQGGMMYDALIVKCAIKENVSRIFTFNVKHFQAVAPSRLLKIIVAP